LDRPGVVGEHKPATNYRLQCDWRIESATGIRAIDGGIPSNESLALWTILEIRWPELADLLREQPTLVEEWSAGRAIPDLLKDREVRALLADERWGRLDAKRIRRCAGLPEPTTVSPS
jgi:hypothetical protein